MRRTLLTVLSASLATPALAQAHPNCSTHPQSLAQMRNCYRPLLVFAPSPTSPLLAQQTKLLDSAADDMMDRFVLLVPVTPAPQRFAPPLDAPYATLPQAELNHLREHFHIASGEFRAILIGEDGSEKIKASSPIPVERLNSTIDSMPTRRMEMQRPHSN